MATYIKKSTLEWSDLWNHLGMTRDNGGRFYPSDSSPEYVNEFLSGHRAPSRSWPHSYAKPLLTQKFAKLLTEKDPELAVKLKIAE